MNKTLIKVAIVASLFSFSGCSTYNSYAPDWAKIGSSSSTEAEESSDSTENESTWWNPFSWW